MSENINSAHFSLDGLIETIIEKHGDRLIERLKPLLTKPVSHQDDTIFDVEGLARYLSVETSWVYKQVSLREIPHFKTGKYTKFRKKDIARWIESQMVKSVLR